MLHVKCNTARLLDECISGKTESRQSVLAETVVLRELIPRTLITCELYECDSHVELLRAAAYSDAVLSGLAQTAGDSNSGECVGGACPIR